MNLGAGRTAQWVDAGGWVTCALLDNGAIKCWGYGEDGALGLRGTSNWGDHTFEMGDNLPVVNVW